MTGTNGYSFDSDRTEAMALPTMPRRRVTLDRCFLLRFFEVRIVFNRCVPL